MPPPGSPCIHLVRTNEADVVNLRLVHPADRLIEAARKYRRLVVEIPKAELNTDFPVGLLLPKHHLRTEIWFQEHMSRANYRA